MKQDQVQSEVLGVRRHLSDWSIICLKFLYPSGVSYNEFFLPIGGPIVVNPSLRAMEGVWGDGGWQGEEGPAGGS